MGASGRRATATTIAHHLAAVCVLALLLLVCPACQSFAALPLRMSSDGAPGGAARRPADDSGVMLPMHRFLPVPLRVASEGNPFAKIIQRQLPATILYEDDELVSASVPAPFRPFAGDFPIRSSGRPGSCRS